MVKVEKELDCLSLEIKMGDFKLDKGKQEKDSITGITYKDMVKILGEPKQVNIKKNAHAKHRIEWCGEINRDFVFRIKDRVINSDYKANKYWQIEAEDKITITLLKAYIQYMQFISL